MTEQSFEIFSGLAFLLIFFPVMWMGTLWLVAQLAGWAKLAGAYRFTGDFQGERWSFQSAKLNWGGYNNVLTVGANWEGLYLVPFLLFRFGHPPLFIPWYDLSIKPGQSLFFRYTEFHCQRVPSVSLKLNQSLAERLAQAAGDNWPGEVS